MSEVKHTPGPWVIDPILIQVKDGGNCPAYIRDQNNVIIADMNFNIPAGIGSKECTANAKLISAAPDMYEIIKELYDWAQATQRFGPIYPKIEAAIKKITT